MNTAPLSYGFFKPLFDRPQRGGTGHPDPFGLFGQSRLRSHPDNIVDRIVVPVKLLFARIQIDYPGVIRMIEPEKIEERTVLTEQIRIVGVVGRRFAVSRQQHQSAAQTGPERLAPGYVGTFIEHNNAVYTQ